MTGRDYSIDVRLAGSRVKRGMLLLAGHIFVGIAVLGIFLPVVPTTFPLIIAAACYVRASARFYNWLLNNHLFGPIILDWRHHRAIRRRHKAVAITLIVLTIGSSVVFFISAWYAKLLVATIGAGVIIFLLRVPTRHEGRVAEPRYRTAELEASD